MSKEVDDCAKSYGAVSAHDCASVGIRSLEQQESGIDAGSEIWSLLFSSSIPAFPLE